MLQARWRPRLRYGDQDRWDQSGAYFTTAVGSSADDLMPMSDRTVGILAYELEEDRLSSLAENELVGSLGDFEVEIE